MEVNDAGVNVSIANEIAVASKLLSEGEFAKNCSLKATEMMCLQKIVFC